MTRVPKPASYEIPFRVMMATNSTLTPEAFARQAHEVRKIT